MFTKQEIAIKLGMSKTQVEKKIIRQMFKEIPEKEFAEKIDGKWFFSFDKIIDFIQKGK